jgi:hypothetical protein
MTKTGSRHAVRLVLALCVALVVSAGPASAAVGLPSLPPPVEEAVGAPVGKVTETVEKVTESVVPPAKETAETVETPPPVPPVAEATETVKPPVKEVVETATKATEEVTHAAAQAPTVPATPAAPSVPAVPPVQPPAVTKPKQVSGGATSSSGSSGSVSRSGTTARVTPSGSSSSTVEPTAAPAVPTETASPGAPVTGGGEGPAARPPDEHQGPTVSTESGAVRAPVPKWVAYVWPAIALTWRHPAATLPTYAKQVGVAASSRAAAGATDEGDAPAQGVKGVHASGGLPPDRADHSSSPFGKIPAAVGGFASGVPGEALAYLILVALIVAAVFVAVKVELGRRGGSGAG